MGEELGRNIYGEEGCDLPGGRGKCTVCCVIAFQGALTALIEKGEIHRCALAVTGYGCEAHTDFPKDKRVLTRDPRILEETTEMTLEEWKGLRRAMCVDIHCSKKGDFARLLEAESFEVAKTLALSVAVLLGEITQEEANSIFKAHDF